MKRRREGKGISNGTSRCGLTVLCPVLKLERDPAMEAVGSRVFR
jgi:hypothetical protein